MTDKILIILVWIMGIATTITVLLFLIFITIALFETMFLN